MARRRANGEGCITQEASGRYRIVLSVWRNGKRQRMARTAWKKADAVAILQAMRVEATGSRIGPPERATVKQYLDSWLADVVAIQRAANTLASYKSVIDKHISPRVGGIRLLDLTPSHVQEFAAAMDRDEVGSRTQEHAFVVLRAAMNHAVSPLKILPENPCNGMSKPVHESADINAFTLEESRLLMSHTEGNRWHAIICIALSCGMRQGELLGLHWSQIDLKAGRIRIIQQAVEISGVITIAKPKSDASVRTVDITPKAVGALRDHKKLMLAEGFAGCAHVFPAPNGGYESRGNFRTRVWQPLLHHLAIEPRGFHHTRHTYATLALGAGVPITIVSKQLGHAKISTTLDTYAHVLEAHQSAAVDTMSKLFG